MKSELSREKCVQFKPAQSQVDIPADLWQLISTPSFLIRATERFFRGVLHPHLLGVCCPDHFFLPDPFETVDAYGALA